MAQLTQSEKEAMAKRHWNLVPHTIKQFYLQGGFNHEDLMESGIMGLNNALLSFDPEKNTKFSTFACTCIKNEILAYLKKENKHVGNVSINKVLTTDKNGHDLEMEDTLAYDEENHSLQADEILMEEERRQHIQKSLDVLTEKQRIVIIKRYGLDGNMEKTQIEVAKEINMSQANVSKLEHDALNRLKFALYSCKKNY